MLVAAAAKHEDAEAVHDLRVSIRRFMQCLREFQPFFGRKRARNMRRRLRRVMNRCGRVRNHQIAMGLIEQAGGHEPHTPAHLQSRLAEEQDRLIEILIRWRQRRVRERWERHLAPKDKPGGDWNLQQSAGENAARILPGRAEALFAAGDQAAAADAGYKKMHRFRLLAKHFRYTLEIFLPVYGDGIKSVMADLRGLQDRLGVINDCVTALKLLDGHPRAAVGVEGLLHQREDEFRRFWVRRFGKAARARWVKKLGDTPGEKL